MNAHLPWEGESTIATGTDGHVRATQLATAAMLAAAAQPADPANSDYAREQARYASELAAIRAENNRRHVEANNRRAAEAAARRAERLADHQARNAEAADAARQRKAAKAA